MLEDAKSHQKQLTEIQLRHFWLTDLLNVFYNKTRVAFFFVKVILALLL